MNSVDNQTFISGTYEVQQANELIKTIYKAIINYHKIENLSSQVRYNMDNEESKNSINIITNEIKELEHTIRIAKLMDKKVQIKSFIEISYV